MKPHRQNVVWEKGRAPGSRLVVCLPYVALVLIHAMLGWQMQLPLLFPDELGYLGHAQYLAGVAAMPDLRGTLFYHFGYSLFLIPAFWFFSDPVSIYKAAIATNALLSSLLYFPLYYLLWTFFQLPRKICLIISVASCLYPAFVLQSNLAWAENAFIPFYALLIAAFGAFLRKQSYWAAAVFGCTVGFLYTIHPRGLPVVPVAVVYLGALVWLQVLPRFETLTSLACISVIFSLTNGINNHLRPLGWGNTRNISVSLLFSDQLFSELSEVELKNLALEAAGQILYLAQATYGLFLFGLGYLGREIWRRRAGALPQAACDKKIHVFAFVLFTSLGIFVTSNIVILGAMRTYGEGDYFIYGRYNEGFLALYITFAFIWLYTEHVTHRSEKSRSPIVAIVIAALTLFVLAGRGNEALSVSVNAVHVFGVFPAVRELGKLDLSTISLIAIFFSILIEKVFHRTFIGGVLLVVMIFSFVIGYDYIFCIMEAKRNVERSIFGAPHP